MSGSQSPQSEKSSDMKSSDVNKRSEGNLGQKEARIDREKGAEMSRMGEKTRKSEKDKGQSR